MQIQETFSTGLKLNPVKLIKLNLCSCASTGCLANGRRKLYGIRINDRPFESMLYVLNSIPKAFVAWAVISECEISDPPKMLLNGHAF